MTTMTNDDISAAVKRAIPRVGADGRSGPHRVFISALWRALRRDPATIRIELDELKRWLIWANKHQIVDLAAADMPGVMNPAMISQSRILDRGAEFHFVVDRDRGKNTHMTKTTAQLDREVKALASSLPDKWPSQQLSDLDAQLNRALSGVEGGLGIKARRSRRTSGEVAKARAEAARIRKEATAIKKKAREDAARAKKHAAETRKRAAEEKKRAAAIKRKAREDAARAKKIAAEEKKRAAAAKKKATSDKKQAAAAKREKLAAVRDATKIKKQARASAAKTTLAAKERVTRDEMYDQLQILKSAVRKVAPTGRFGEKVFVYPIWKIAGPKLGLGLAEFKQWLLLVNRTRKITLARLDLTGAISDKDMLSKSEIDDRGSTFHAILD
jgi:hypothetical protein